MSEGELIDLYLDELEMVVVMVEKPQLPIPTSFYFSELQKIIARRLNIPIINVTVREKS